MPTPSAAAPRPAPQKKWADDVTLPPPEEEGEQGRARHSNERRKETRDRPRHLLRNYGQASTLQPNQPQTGLKRKKSKPVLVKAVQKDVFIPSAISVGNLATLLKVKPGKFFFGTRRMTP